jgi:hypothetical protein
VDAVAHGGRYRRGLPWTVAWLAGRPNRYQK